MECVDNLEVVECGVPLLWVNASITEDWCNVYRDLRIG